MTKKDQPGIFMRLLSILLDYGPIMLTVLAAIVFSFQTSSPGYAGDAQKWILIILAFLATTQLVDRFRLLRNLETKVTSIEEKMQHSGAGGMEVSDNISDDQIRDRLQSAKNISVLGLTLLRTSISYRQLLADYVKAGGNLRLMVLNPDDELLLETVSRLGGPPNFNRDYIKQQLKQSIPSLQYMFSKSPAKKNSGVRLLKCQPPYGIWMFDEGTTRAEIWVTVYGFKEITYFTLHLTPSQNKRWFGYFKDQYNMMWEEAVPVS